MDLKETTLTDVLPRLNLSFVRREGKHDVYLCFSCGDRKGHLYVNVETGLWCCFRCGEKGNPLTLYAKVRGISSKAAYREIHGGREGDEARFKKRFRESIPEAVPEAPIERRDAVYRDFLKMLPLYERHARDLKRRGFRKEQVIKNLYRSLPDDPSERRKIVAHLAARYDLTGVRGFRKERCWECYYTPGYLIPFRDRLGRIQALQIRRDKGDPKYVFFGFRDSGIDHTTPVHVVNPEIAKRTRSAWVTEGPLKADAAAPLLEACVVAPPGVSSWRALIPVLEDLSVSEVVQAFDRDQDLNPAVMKCARSFEEALAGKARLFRAVWPEELGRGLDDALLSIRERRVVRVKSSPSSLVIREVKETEIVLRKVRALR